MDIEVEKIQEVASLHEEMASHLKRSLEVALEIIELLTDQRKFLNDPDFSAWVEVNLRLARMLKTAANAILNLIPEREKETL